MELVIILIFLLLTIIIGITLLVYNKNNMVNSNIDEYLNIYEKQLKQIEDTIKKNNKQINDLEHKIFILKKKLNLKLFK